MMFGFENYNLIFKEKKPDKQLKSSELFSTILKKADKADKLTDFKRSSGYTTLEALTLIKLAINSKTDSSQRQLLSQYLNCLINGCDALTNWEFWKKVNRAPDSEIKSRINIFNAYMAGNRIETITEAQELLLLKPDWLEGIVLIGDIKRETGKIPESIKYFTNALTLDSGYSYAYANRGLSYRDTRKYTEAIEDLKRAIELSPKYFDALMALSWIYVDMKENENALAIFRRLKIAVPDFNDINFYIGCTFMEMQNYDSSMLYLNKAIKINPRYSAALRTRGDFYLLKTKFLLAENDYSKCIDLDPDNNLYYILRGEAYSGDKKYELALKDFQKAVELKKDFAYPYSRIGNYYQYTEKYDLAIEYYNKARKLAPYDFRYYLMTASALEKLNKYDQAITMYQEALEINPDLEEAYGNIGWNYYLKDDFQKCIIYSKKAVELSDTAMYAKFNLAIATLRIGNFEEATALYLKYYNESPANPAVDGGIRDLEALINKGIMRKEAETILTEIFHHNLQH